MTKTAKGNLLLFFGLSYLVFWALLGITGGIMALGAPPVALTIMKNVCAWAPTMVVAILFKRLNPGVRLPDYLRRHFCARARPPAFVLTLVIQAGITAGAIALQMAAAGTAANAVPFIGLPAALIALVVNVTSGPMGEELGWRGYALHELQKRRTPFASALIVGAAWGFWHTPLWLMSGFAGMDLLRYVGCFLAAIVSLSVVITFFYNRGGNVLVAMWIHFLFNFLLQIVAVDLLGLLTYLAAGYAILAAALAVVGRRSLFLKPRAG
jgi:membrane protease YdiL (CAAX protease family)